MKSTIRSKMMTVCAGLLLLVLIFQLGFGIFLSRRFIIWRTEREITNLYGALSANYTDDPDGIFALTGKAESNYRVNITITDGTRFIYTNRRSGKDFFAHSPFEEMPVNGEKATTENEDTTPEETKKSETQPANAAKDNKMPGSGLPALEVPAFEPIPQGEKEKNEDFWISTDDFSETPQVERISNGKDDTVNAMLLLRGKIAWEEETRYIAIWVPVESIDSAVEMFSQVTVGISVVMLLLGLCVAYLISRGLTKPIENIETVSRQIAELDFTQKADESVKTKELAGLARSINSMADRLQQSFDELRLANERLAQDIDRERQVEKMRREFIANVSHEMKTPLCLLQMYSENLKNGVEGIDRDYYCQTIIDETLRLDEMVKSMLDISNVENGLSSLEKVPLDFSDLTSYTLSKLSILAEEQNFVTHIEKNIRVCGDAHYLEQAIKNYITNAVTHTAPGDKIEVTLAKQGQNAVFSVFNEGQGVDPEKLPHIWESFYKTDEARVRKDGVHAGLGLYIVRIIAEKHGGSCQAENRENGVLFSFTLPMV